MTEPELQRELRRYTLALEHATQPGFEYQVEGWGGRWKTRRVGPADWLRTCLEVADRKLSEDTSDLI